METSLRIGAWDRVDRHAASLESYTREEPLPLTDFFIRRGRALAAFGHDSHDEDAAAQLRHLRDTGKHMNFRTALLAIEQALPTFQ